MDGFHTIEMDHNDRSLCPVRTCEYAVLGFTNLDLCMQHLSLHHGKWSFLSKDSTPKRLSPVVLDPSKPFADYSTERGIAVAEKPV